MNISELEARTGITKQNIRFYEKSIEDIRGILQGKLALSEMMEQHLAVLLEKRKELDAGIEICKSLSHTDLDALDADCVLQRMEELERGGGKFMSILNDYKKVVRAEERKQFSFKPDNMALTPAEFTEALFQYADENNLNLVITKESMYPVFEIDGVEYTAERNFSRFGATIRCRMTHPEEAEKEVQMVPGVRRKLFRVFYRSLIPVGLLLYFMAVSKSVSLGILLCICIVPVGLWTFDAG